MTMKKTYEVEVKAVSESLRGSRVKTGSVDPDRTVARANDVEFAPFFYFESGKNPYKVGQKLKITVEG